MAPGCSGGEASGTCTPQNPSSQPGGAGRVFPTQRASPTTQGPSTEDQALEHSFCLSHLTHDSGEAGVGFGAETPSTKPVCPLHELLHLQREKETPRGKGP